MALLPGRVGDLRDDRLDARVLRVVAVIERDGIEAVAEHANLRQQPDRPGRAVANLAGDTIAHRLIEQPAVAAQIVLTPESCERRPAYGPQPASAKYVVEFRQVEPEQANAVAEGMWHRFVATMPKPTGIDGAAHGPPRNGRLRSRHSRPRPRGIRSATRRRSSRFAAHR